MNIGCSQVANSHQLTPHCSLSLDKKPSSIYQVSIGGGASPLESFLGSLDYLRIIPLH